MKQIIFVCRDNVHQSPLAEFYMRQLLREAGLDGLCETDSAATGGSMRGSPVSPAIMELLDTLGIDASEKRARVLHPAEYTSYDMLIGLTSDNLRYLHRVCHGDPEQKLHLLQSFSIHSPAEEPESWKEENALFRTIATGCRSLLFYLQESGFFCEAEKA